jgi:hypothetical protein
MGQIEFEVRNLLRVAGIPGAQTVMYLACAREMYSDFENTKPQTVEAALEQTVNRWLARDITPELVNHIRTRVTRIYSQLKTQRFNPLTGQPVVQAAAAVAVPEPVGVTEPTDEAE